MEAGETIKFRWSPHLWVVVSDPKQNPDEILLVNYSSRKPGVPFDSACMVNVGDHAYLRTPSFVYYRFARVASNAALEAQIASGEADASAWPPVSASLLDRMRKGAGVEIHRQEAISSALKDQD